MLLDWAPFAHIMFVGYVHLLHGDWVSFHMFKNYFSSHPSFKCFLCVVKSLSVSRVTCEEGGMGAEILGV